jgi:NADH-quinone oxidoreductase subunit L
VAFTGAFTAVYAATMAFVQTDIKRVLAYSTISQIGYMFMGVGVGAYSAGIFHLVTHSFFKALLFLAAGSVIHALSGQQDMRRMGGLRARLPMTYRVFLVGALAIAGLPGLSGFFSKDEILAAAFASGHYSIWALGIVGAGMTAFYIFRLIFLTFFGQTRTDPEVRPHLRESPAVMIIPLQCLAALAVAGGVIGLPPVMGGKNWVSRFLESSTGPHGLPLAPGTELLLMAVSTAVSLAGACGAYYVYLKKEGLPARRLAERFRTLSAIVSRKYYVDEFYNGVIVAGALRAGRFASWFDSRILDGLVDGAAWLTRRISAGSILFDNGVIDGFVNGIGSTHRAFSRGLSRLQTGFIYNYALALVIGIVILISLAATVL